MTWLMGDFFLVEGIGYVDNAMLITMFSGQMHVFTNQ